MPSAAQEIKWIPGNFRGVAIPPLHDLGVYFGFGFSWSAMQYAHTSSGAI